MKTVFSSDRGCLAVEKSLPQGWNRYVGDQGDVVGLDHFGASAPGAVLMREFDFTVENIVHWALRLLSHQKRRRKRGGR